MAFSRISDSMSTQGTKQIASIQLTVRVYGMTGSLQLTDFMFQPGSTTSDWVPYVDEMEFTDN